MARKRRTGTERLKELLEILKSEPSGDLRPALAGYASRFTLYLPLLAEGKPVLTGEQCDLLGDLFPYPFCGLLRDIGGWEPTLVRLVAAAGSRQSGN